MCFCWSYADLPERGLVLCACFRLHVLKSGDNATHTHRTINTQATILYTQRRRIQRSVYTDTTRNLLSRWVRAYQNRCFIKTDKLRRVKLRRSFVIVVVTTPNRARDKYCLQKDMQRAKSPGSQLKSIIATHWRGLRKKESCASCCSPSNRESWYYEYNLIVWWVLITGVSVWGLGMGWVYRKTYYFICVRKTISIEVVFV